MRGLHYYWHPRFATFVGRIINRQPGKKKKKSHTFFNGKAGTRSTRDKMVIENQEEYAAWVEKQDDPSKFKKVTVEYQKTPLLEYFLETGEIPPGTDFEPKYDKFFPENEATKSFLERK